MPDIIITEAMDERAVDGLRAEFEVLHDPTLTDNLSELARLMPGVPGLIVRNQTQVRGAVLDNADSLLCVGRLGVGLDNIDTDTCTARGIEVFPATGANSDSVAELAIGAIFVLFRDAYHVTDEVTGGGWPRPRMMGREVQGKHLGIAGFGSIGRALAWRALGVGMVVSAWDPYVAADDPRWKESGVHRVATLDDLLPTSDVLSVHVPLTDETRDLIDNAELGRLPDRALVLNLARGGIVNEPALVSALKDGRIGGAYLDVFVTEPLKDGSLFAGVPNLLLTPHVGAKTEEGDERVSTMIADAVRDCLKTREG